MRKVLVMFAVVLTAFLVAHFGFGYTIPFSAESKINAAFPLSEPVRHTRTLVLDGLSRAQRKVIDTEFQSRMTVRALNCANGFSPAWYTSEKTIHRQLDAKCFHEVDKATLLWLGLIRAGTYLAKPPLRPVPSGGTQFIVAGSSIQAVRFADHAGIALLGTSEAIEVVDFENQKTLFREPKSSTAIGHISPNGRLFTTSEGELLKIRDAETGETVVEMPSVRVHAFQWLDNSIGVYSKGNTGKSYFIDFLTGKEVQVEVVSGGVSRVVRVPGSETQYLLISHRAVTKIELVRTDGKLDVKLLGEKQLDSLPFASGHSDMTSDGAYLFSALRTFRLMSLATLTEESVSFDPMMLHVGVATSDPDKIILRGYVPHVPSMGQNAYIYSIASKTLAQIDSSQRGTQRYVFIPSIKKLAVIEDNKVSVMETLATQDPIPLDKFVANVRDSANQAKLNAASLGQASGYLYSPSGVRYRPGDATEPAAPAPGMAAHEGVNRVLAELAKGAQVEAVGIYQPKKIESRLAGSAKSGQVDVRVRRTGKPLVLVLSSYETVEWRLTLEPGAKLALVLVSSYKPSSVTGAGRARITVAGNYYAYKIDSHQYLLLNQQTKRWLNKGIDIFQGQYEGRSFVVGG